MLVKYCVYGELLYSMERFTNIGSLRIYQKSTVNKLHYA